MLGIHTVIHAVELSAVCEGIRKVAEARAAVAQDICKNLRTEADIKRQSIKKWLNEYEQARKNYFLTILRERNEYWCGYCNRTYSRGTELPEEMSVEQERVVMHICPSCQKEIAQRKRIKLQSFAKRLLPNSPTTSGIAIRFPRKSVSSASLSARWL